MVRSCARIEQPYSSSNLGDVTTTPSSHRVLARSTTGPESSHSFKLSRPVLPQPSPEMDAAERSGPHQPLQAQRKVACTVRSVTVQLELVNVCALGLPLEAS